MSSENLLTVTLTVDLGSKIDRQELDSATRQLLAGLRELPIESAELPVEDTLPEGAMASEALTLGALALAMLPSVLPTLVEYLKVWEGRKPNRRVKIHLKDGEKELEVEYDTDALSNQEIARLINQFKKSL